MAYKAKGQRRDWGSMSEVRKGVWRIRYWAETNSGYRRCSETIRGTRRQAGDRLAELRVAHGSDAPCPTLEACWTHWYLPDRKLMVSQGDLAPQSLMQYRSTWKQHVSKRWATVPADRVKPLDVQQWLLGLKRVAAESSMHLMRQILDYPLRYGYINANPLAIRYLLPSAATVCRREDGVWSPDALGEVWRASWGTWFESAVLLAGFGGCRVGEALGVRSSDVHLKCVEGVSVAFVRIERQIDASSHEANRTKNKWSTRTALLAGRPAQRLTQLANKVEGSCYLTRAPGRRYCPQSVLRTAFAERLEGQGVEKHLFKNLRKTWQTNARWVLRLPPWVIEPMMGHVGEGVTARHYDKPTEQVFAEMLAQAWSQHPFADQYMWLEKD